MRLLVSEDGLSPTRQRRFWPLAIATAAWVALLAPIAVISAMTGLIADGPGSAVRIATVIYLSLAWPILVVISVVGAWLAYWRGRERVSWWLIAAPAAWPAVPLLAGTILLPHFWSAS